MKNRSRFWTILVFIAIAVFVFLRVWRLGTPVETVFDEVYFPKMASQYLAGEAFFDIHPPLGKLIIAFGEFIFGNNPIGWRIMPLLAGIGLLPAGYWAMRQLFGDENGKRAGLIAALLFAIDGLLIVYSRTGLMDGFILLFGILSIGFCWQFIHQREAGDRGAVAMLLTGMFAGLAFAVKWIGIGFLPLVAGTVLIVMLVHKKRSIDFTDFQLWFMSFVIAPAILYTVPFLANWQTDFWSQFALWHQQSWDYNVGLDATHPYSSKWWSWPFLVRPIWFYYQGNGGNVIGVDGIGNPLEWWASTLAVVYTILAVVYSFLTWSRQENQILTRKQLWPVLFLLAGWGAFFLPWAVIGRVLFLYHYLTSYVFALLLMAFWLGAAWRETYNWIFVGLALTAMVISGGLFAPIWIAYPIPQEYFNWLMWFKSWI
jgi:dolichyl-phosphate-mannose--protein O-mannosyl transferase